MDPVFIANLLVDVENYHCAVFVYSCHFVVGVWVPFDLLLEVIYSLCFLGCDYSLHVKLFFLLSFCRAEYEDRNCLNLVLL